MAFGDSGMRPNVALSPTRPQKPAGMRIEPPPSPPVASVRIPPATAAASHRTNRQACGPAATGWRSCRAGGARDIDAAELGGVVCPASTALVADALDHRRRGRGDLIGERHRGMGVRPPATSSSSLTPIRTPPKGKGHIGDTGRDGRPFAVDVAEGVQGLASIAVNTASSSSTGERSPRRKASTSEQASPVTACRPYAERSRRTGRPGTDPGGAPAPNTIRARWTPARSSGWSPPQPVPLEAAGDDGTPRPAVTSCSGAPGWGRRSPPWRARRGARRSGRRGSTVYARPGRWSTSTSSSPSKGTR